MKTVMAISPHADDAAIFCGGALARFADEGWRVVLVRVTDDRYDSLGLSVAQTVQANAAELRASSALLGVAEVVDLGFETDRLADVPETVLRERVVYLLRRHRPHTVLSFDPAHAFEDNQDHVRVAQAVAESFWVSCFDKHHPEHFREGLAPFTPAERWYFSRGGTGGDHLVDVTAQIGRKVEAVLAHPTMLRNLLNQYRLQLATAGRRVPLLDDGASGGDLRPLVGRFVLGTAAAVADAAGLPEGRFAEVYRRERFGELEGLFEQLGEDLEEGA